MKTRFQIKPLACKNRNQQGVALVIVLAFIVLLTGLVVAFFTRATNETQLAGASASNVKAELFAQGAADVIIADLKQEIAAGSIVSGTFVASSGTAYLYTPKSAAAMLPASVGSTRTGGLESLVKRSTSGVSFYPSSGYDSSASNRAAKISTTGTSLNGRYVSPARWNAPMLLVKANLNANNDSDLTPVFTFAPPDWVLVDRAGGNPTPSGSLPADLKWSTTNPSTVIGRYAYTIYDEGGLLDINAAGYSPTATAAAGASGTAFVSSKASLAYADLKQIPGIKDLPASASGSVLTQDKMADNIVGWRNFVSASTDWTKNPPALSSGGTINDYLGNFTFAGTEVAANYHSYILSNTTGYLKTAPQYVRTVNGRYASDHLMLSRQELIRFFLSGCASHANSANGISERAKLQNALPYFTHFTRDVNQPSYVPATFGSSNPAPKVNARASGGNSAVTSAGVDGTQIINPSFLTVRAGSAFTRNDGSTALKDVEPLVKKRFALNRLAWLTYAGPITLNGTSYNPNLNSSYITTLKTTYGFTDSFLLQGTPQNTFKYFGLAWVTVTDPVDNSAKPMWVYDHTTTTMPTGASAAGKIQTLRGVAALSPGRDADFFELIKAAVNVGSIAKAASDNTAGGWILAQYNRDIQVDFAIIQMGANIIDQYDLDGYPTTIYFDDGAAPSTYGSYKTNQFHGVESMPYLYRLRASVLKASLPAPFGTSPHVYTTTAYTNPLAPNQLKQTGIACLLQLPEVWNPHDWDASNTAQSTGIVGPTKLRIFAVGETGAWYNAVQDGAYASGRSSSSATVNASIDTGGANTWFGSQFADGTTIKSPQLWTLSHGNTVMTFDMANTAFREPTVLYMIGKYGLKADGIADTGGGLASKFSASGRSLLIGNGGGIKSAVTDPAGVGAAAGQEFAGFCVGAIPLRWITSGTQCYSTFWVRSDTVFQQMVYLQYQDASGNWVTYDEKLADNPFGAANHWGTMRSASQSFFDIASTRNVAGTWSSHVVDPRSSRFGMPIRFVTNDGWSADSPLQASNTWVTNSGTDLWVDGPNGVVHTMRPDASAGVPLYPNNTAFYPGSAGWYPGATIFNSDQKGRASLRPGLLSQNNPVFVNDAKITATAAAATNSNFSGSPNASYQFYTDPDGVVRRAMGAYVSGASSTVGLPLATANIYSAGAAARDASQSPSRPVVLNRPFRSVGELGYAFSGTPWRNLDCSTPESGNSALLDAFCINETGDSRGIVAGKVNLNTRQYPVLQAIIAGAYKDEWKSGNSTDLLLASNGTDPAAIASALVARTSGTMVNSQAPPTATAQPLANVADLIGRWDSAMDVAAPGADANNKTDGRQSYTGFIGDANLTSALGTTASVIERYREAPIRALATSGQTRVWNLMIDVLAQTGRYPQSAADLNKFLVEGEQRYWVHVAIDRLTGEVIDKQIEVVKE